MKILNKSPTTNNCIDHILDILFRKDSLKIKKRNTIMTSKHINYAYLLFLNLICPLLQKLSRF